MGIRGVLFTAAMLLLVCAGAAYADDGAPPAGVAMPDQGPPPPPPPPVVDGVELVLPPQDGSELPIYPTGQPRRQLPPEPTTVTDFDASVGAVCGRVPCDPCDPCPSVPCDPCRLRGYGGVVLQAYPGLGVGVEFGVWFKQTACVDWAVEVNLNYQDLTQDFNGIEGPGQGGKWVGTRVGVKASFLPRGNSHPTLRAGLGWQVESGDAGRSMDLGDIPGSRGQTNYFGGYLGVGWEFDIFNDKVTTGPEVWGWMGYPEQGSEEAWTVTFAWHFLVNF